MPPECIVKTTHAQKFITDAVLPFCHSVLRARRTPGVSDATPTMSLRFEEPWNAPGIVCDLYGRPLLVPDPAAATGTAAEIAHAFADTYRMLDRRISLFTALPLASIDRMTLQHRLREIGRNQGATARAKAQ